MRIVRGHDYYDIGLSQGRDDDIIFVRDGKEFKIKDVPLQAAFTNWRFEDMEYYSYLPYCIVIKNRKQYRFSSVTAVVANKQYGGIKIEILDSHAPVKTLYFWNYDKLFAKLKQFGIKIKDKRYFFIPSHHTSVDLKSWMTPRELNKNETEWAIENKVAIAMLKTSPNEECWKINCAESDCSLKSIGFAEVMDPYTLFQELSMWVGGVLPKSGPTMVTISDGKILTAKHGFDKWSFRKHKDDSK